MFDPVDPRQSFPDLERGILRFWKEEDIFRRSVKQRSAEKRSIWDKPTVEKTQNFSFYDGPPFATGLPHYGHLLAGTVKDVIPRYQTMRGKKVERRFGWDCHGLPVENLVEKEHDIKSKKDIEEKGVRWFNDLCRGSVLRYTAEWRTTVERMGRWVDMDYDYRTMDPDYMESIWWVFHELFDKGLVYEGYKGMYICPRCATALSNFEVTLGYRDREDLSVIMAFPLKDDPKTILLSWTTTPWSLPGNMWLAVGEHISYARVREKGSDVSYILAEKLVPQVLKGKEYEIVESINPHDLVGKRYEPLFPYFTDRVMPSTQESSPKTYEDLVFKVVMYDDVEVTEDEGTGIVHITSCLGEDSYAVAKHEKVDVSHHVGIDGNFADFVTDFAGLNAKPEGDDPMATDKAVIQNLQNRGRHFAHFPHSHSYPHCWRCDSPLLPYTTNSWFVAVEKIKKDLLQANAETRWVPAHVRDGRFGKWLENARDWAISRNRYWGTPLPIWRNEEGEIAVIASRDALMEKCAERFTKLTVLRHAESEGNLIPIYQGEVPGTSLTKEGKKQAKATAKRLKGQNIAVIYASPLARTKETAEELAKQTGAHVIIDDRLREVSFGEWEGKTVDFSDLTFVKERRAHKLETGQPESIYHLKGMETWDKVQKRIQDFCTEILPKHKGQHIAIVSHADPVVNIKHFFTKEDPLKLSHQPYPKKAQPHTFFWDHERQAQMDLHKDTVDEISWKEGQTTFQRIPEVLDCWFESGSMPYAQMHFPFEGEEKNPPGFPADFIAENLDQTRGWFYTLMVLSTALFQKPAFQNCICGGIILAEDGKKMSKRLKNYPDPNELMETHGADALRFSLMSSPVVRAETLRFSERAVEETVKNVILPLWNVYSFFVLHANEAQFIPQQTRNSSEHSLDQWIRAAVQDLANRMTEQLDAYDLSATCGELHETLDALTNWYVRRSRRRFAGKEGDDARDEALTTLYDVLLTFCQLLAPFCPFVTEAIYVNLVPTEHGSLHLTDWPATRSLHEEEQALLVHTDLLRTIVSLGMQLRGEANIKVRQPLGCIDIALPVMLSQTDRELIAQELNVKDVNVLSDASTIAERSVEVDARKVGPRLGAKVQDVIRAAKAGEFTEEGDKLSVHGETLSPEEFRIVFRGKEDQPVASEHGIVVRLDTEMTDALKKEGLARDIVRSIQALRKERGLTVADAVGLEEGEGMEVVEAHRALIERETNGKFAGQGVLTVRIDLEGEKVVVTAA